MVLKIINSNKLYLKCIHLCWIENVVYDISVCKYVVSSTYNFLVPTMQCINMILIMMVSQVTTFWQ